MRFDELKVREHFRMPSEYGVWLKREIEDGCNAICVHGNVGRLDSIPPDHYVIRVVPIWLDDYENCRIWKGECER